MNKVYLLLRNNNKTGPHSLEELVQLGLKPLDLIWIEGKSLAWSYPSEISALKPYVVQSNQSVPNQPTVKEAPVISGARSSTTHQAYMPPNQQAPVQPAGPSARKVYVSMPNNMVQQSAPASHQSTPADLEQKAEELRRRTQAYASANKPAVPVNKPVTTDNKSVAPVSKAVDKGDTAQVKYARPVGELEEEYSSWIYKQKSKKKKNLSWGGIAAAIAVVLLLGAAFGISKYDSSETEPVAQNEPVTQELTEKDIPNNESLIPPTVEPEANSPQPVNNEKPSSTFVEPERKANTSFASNTSSASFPKKEAPVTLKQAGVKESVPAIKSVEKVKENISTPAENSNKVVAKTKEETGGAKTEAPAKKKTFGEAIGGFFNKFKRKVDAVQAEDGTTSKPENNADKQPTEKPQSTMQNSGTERKAKRRGDESGSVETATNTVPVAKTNFEDMVDISSNEPAEKWMLGVHGLKLTVHNKSNETLRAAAVEVRYYSEQNELLEKKIVNFTNVQPLKSVTQPVPDHRLADHTEYRFLSANN